MPSPYWTSQSHHDRNLPTILRFDGLPAAVDELPVNDHAVGVLDADDVNFDELYLDLGVGD